MKQTKRSPFSGHDPDPYDGPIERADGIRPYNHYLWPTESWWLNREFPHSSSRWTFSIVALKDGRYSVEGSVYHIAKNESLYRPELSCCFATRKAAIRAAAARLIQVMKHSRNWEDCFDSLQGEALANAINWALAVVARETQGKPPRRVTITTPPPPRQPPRIQTRAQPSTPWAQL